MQSINLDCVPGGIRPGDLITDVIAGTGLKLNPPVSKFFGNWCWEFDVEVDKWMTDIQPIIKPRIEALYHSGLIRYGDW